MPQGPFVKPINRILVGDYNVPLLDMEVGANATAAKMVPGRLVIHDTTDGDVKEAGVKADNVLGVIEVQAGKLVTDSHSVGANVKVIPLSSQAFVVLTLVSGGAAVAPGDPIVSAADGKAAKQAVGAMGSQGSVVAHAWETANPSGSDVTCIAQLVPGAEPAAAS